MNRIDKLEYDEEERLKLMSQIDEIRAKRGTLQRNHSATDIRTYTSLDFKEHQKEFNQRRKQAIERALNRKEHMETENYRQKLFIAHRKSIEGNIKVELRAIKLVRLWQEKRKARFVKQIWLKKIIFKLAKDYSRKRQQWLSHINRHLMTYRIQKFWRKFVSKLGMTFAIRRARTLNYNFMCVYKLNNAMGIDDK